MAVLTSTLGSSRSWRGCRPSWRHFAPPAPWGTPATPGPAAAPAPIPLGTAGGGLPLMTPTMRSEPSRSGRRFAQGRERTQRWQGRGPRPRSPCQGPTPGGPRWLSYEASSLASSSGGCARRASGQRTFPTSCNGRASAACSQTLARPERLARSTIGGMLLGHAPSRPFAAPGPDGAAPCAGMQAAGWPCAGPAHGVASAAPERAGERFRAVLPRQRRLPYATGRRDAVEDRALTPDPVAEARSWAVRAATTPARFSGRPGHGTTRGPTARTPGAVDALAAATAAMSTCSDCGIGGSQAGLPAGS